MRLNNNSLSRELPRKRVAEIDFLRGLALFLMILDHICFDLANADSVIFTVLGGTAYFKVSSTFFADASSFCTTIFYFSTWRLILHSIFVGVFFFLSGISCSFSKNNLVRSLQLGIIAVLINVAFYMFSVMAGQYLDSIFYSYFITIGMINALSIGLIVYSIFDRFCTSPLVDIGIAIVLIVVICLVTPIQPTIYESFPKAIQHLGEIFLGKAIAGADCARPLPGICLVFFGAGVGKYLYKEKKSYLPFLSKIPPFCFLGKHSLGLYLLHQPVIILILVLVAICLGYRVE